MLSLNISGAKEKTSVELPQFQISPANSQSLITELEDARVSRKMPGPKVSGAS